MASGPRLGTLIHQALQELEFDATDLTGTLSAWLATAVAQRPELLGCEPRQAAVGLALALATPLGGEFGPLALTGVSRADRLDELAFELPLAGGDEPVSAARPGRHRRAARRASSRPTIRSPDTPSGCATRCSRPRCAAITTCGRCHAGANLSFVQYQPHANARDRKLSPGLYFVRLFMNLLLASVLTFFMIHTILWLIRSRYNQVKNKAANGGKNA